MQHFVFETNKEFRLRNSRAERGRLRHISSSRECASFAERFFSYRNEVSYTKKIE